MQYKNKMMNAARQSRNKSLQRKALVINLLLMIVGVAQVQANGIGTPQLINVPTGSYLVSVWTDPEPLRVGEAHVTVAVTDPETDSPILDARVIVELMWLDDPSVLLTAPATHENVTLKIVYAARFEPPQAGEWQGTVLVDEPDGSGEAVTFDMLVLPVARINWSLISGLALGLLMAGWMAWSWFGDEDGNGR